VSESRNIQNIALIGFMGTGKSSVGHIVAEQLQLTFVDTDKLIEDRAGRTISQIFEQSGETAFREYERAVVEELRHLKRAIISTGGGLGANRENLASLKQHALVVCLWASPRIIWKRVQSQTHRPLLQGPDPKAKIRELLASRESVYRQADVLVNTEVRSVKEVAQHVMHEFQLATRHR
jgi:shikimate kinase